MNSDESRFIIAYNFRCPAQSLILRRNVGGSPEETISETDVASFIGQGIWLCAAKVIESIGEAEDFVCEIEFDGQSTAFEIVSIIQSFPVIKGEIAAGIYRFDKSEADYYEIKDALTLLKVFNENPNFDSEHKKLVCSAQGISLRFIEDSSQINFYDKYPFSFFDVYCPLCRAKVMTYEADPDNFQCQPLALSCPHLVGYAVWSPAGYEREALTTLKINYKLVGENLYFETQTGWQKPVIYTPPPDPKNSFWSNALREGGYADHFFFLESEPQFWIR